MRGCSRWLRRARGKGFGRRIVARIVEELDGEIQAESGMGTQRRRGLHPLLA